MVDLRPDQLAIVQGILKAEVPDVEVWAFGSRARWTSGETSDLDLVLRSEKPLAASVLNRLRELFEDSYLPFGVDVVDWARLDEEFQAVIESEKVAISIPRNSGSGRHLASPWRAMPLSECADFLSGGTPSKSQPELWAGTTPWISAKDMKQLRLRDAEDHVSSEAIGSGTRVVPAGTVLMLVRGMTLHKDLPICITDTEMAFNQDVKALVPRPGIEPLFLAYSLLGNKPALLTLVDSASHGTGRIHSGALQSFPIAVPPLPEQRAIVHILGTLDDKIELNRLQVVVHRLRPRSRQGRGSRSWVAEALGGSFPGLVRGVGVGGDSSHMAS
jgi:predicted nucleotidyltransferase